MGEEERMARQQCWTGLKTRYESDRGPRRVMLMEKFFALRKTESVSMDDHLIEVKEVANLLEEVGVNIPEDIIVYYTLKNLPKEYEIFKRMQIGAQSLPTYEQLEAKLITEEAFIKFESQQKEEGEAFFSHHDRFRRPQSAPRSSNFSAAPNPRYSYASSDSRTREDPRSRDSRTRWSQEDFLRRGTSTHRNLPDQHRGTTRRSPINPDIEPGDQNKPRNDKCNFCGLDGHFERECDLRSILDQMKDYEHRLLQQRNRNLGGQGTSR